MPDISEHLLRALYGGQLLGAIGLVLTLVGAVIAAVSVQIDRTTSGRLAAARWSSENDVENADLPLAVSLRRQAKWAARGLWFVAAGTLMQIAALAQSLFSAS